MWLWHDNPGRLCTTINHIVLDHTSRLVNRTTFTLDSYFLKAKIIYLYLIHQIWLRTTLCWLRQQKYQTQPPRTNSLQKTVQIMYYISENNPQRGVSRNMWHRITGIMELFRWTWGQQGGWKENRKNMRGDTCLDFFFIICHTSILMSLTGQKAVEVLEPEVTCGSYDSRARPRRSTPQHRPLFAQVILLLCASGYSSVRWGCSSPLQRVVLRKKWT